MWYFPNAHFLWYCHFPNLYIRTGGSGGTKPLREKMGGPAGGAPRIFLNP